MAFSHEPLLLLLLTFSAFWFLSISAASPATSRDASNARIEGSLVSGDYRTNISPSMGGRTILANISIGQPPIPQLVIMDTGSDIFWIMCIPCSNCAQHLGELFDPLKSSTYTPLCRTPCAFNGCRCNNLGQATFNITYADHSLSSGTLGKDMLVFETADEGTTQVPNVEFGCGLNVVYNSDPGYNGILGLNNGPLSLASQIGQKFSYCIGSLSDKNYNFNQLILGDGADLEGYSTSFQVRNGMYYLTMEGISIGEKRLDIAPATFELKADGTGGVILDTGSTVTYLVDEVFDLLVEEVGNILSRSLRQVRFEAMPWLLCYSGTVSRDLAGFPVVTFHFAQGADLALDTGSFFEQSLDDAFKCHTSSIVHMPPVVNCPEFLAIHHLPQYFSHHPQSVACHWLFGTHHYSSCAYSQPIYFSLI